MTLFLTHPCILYSFKNWDKGFLPLNNLSREWGCVQRAVKTNESEEKGLQKTLGQGQSMPPPSLSLPPKMMTTVLKCYCLNCSSHTKPSPFFSSAYLPREPELLTGGHRGPVLQLPEHVWTLVGFMDCFQGCTKMAILLPPPHPPHPARLSEPLHCIIELCCLDVPLPLFQQPGDPRKLLVCLNKTLNPPY